MEYNLLSATSGETAFKRALKRGKYSFLRKKDNVKTFKELLKEENLSNKIFIGLKEVPLKNIKGSIEKFQDFDSDFNPKLDKAKTRWVSIYNEITSTGNIPPVTLYKVNNDYYVYDGNHRVSVAKYLNFLSIEAEVYELFSTKNTEANKLNQTEFAFKRETGLDNIFCSSSENYEVLRKELLKFESRYPYEENSFKLQCDLWYDTFFNPTINILQANFSKFRNQKNGDIFVEFLKYKDEAREKRGTRGYSYALIDYLNRNKNSFGSDLKTKVYLDNILIESLRKMRNLDKIIWHSEDMQNMIKAIREYKLKIFKVEELIVGEILLYSKLNGNIGFIIGMQLWFDNVFDFYKNEIREKLKFLKIELAEEELQVLVEDVIRFSRVYRKIYNRLLSNIELVYSYILEVALPIFQNVEDIHGDEKLDIDKYQKISQSYMYYKRYMGKDNILKYIRDNFEEEEEKSFLDIFMSSRNSIEEYSLKNDLLSYPTIKKYGGTDNYRTIYKLRKFIESLGIKDRDKIDKKIRLEIIKLLTNKEVIIEYNNKRILNYVREKWNRYTFIDFFVEFLNKN